MAKDDCLYPEMVFGYKKKLHDIGQSGRAWRHEPESLNYLSRYFCRQADLSDK